MRRPTPRGPLGAAVDQTLGSAPGSSTGPATAPSLAAAARAAVAAAERAGRDVLDDDDVQLTLTVLYELHYQGLDGVDERWEWDPEVLAARAVLEGALETSLRAVAAGIAPDVSADGGVTAALFALSSVDLGPSLSRHLERRGTREEWGEFLTHRSVYHLKEADPHTWVIPRLAGRPKAAAVEIQADEYGGGRPERMHSALFAQTLREVGMDATYGAAVDLVPAASLASVNAMSLMGLHRRLRGAAVGHLASVEMTSTAANRRYGNGLRRLGFGPRATAFFDEHVEADAVHEQIVAHDLAGALVADEPHLLDDVLLGARIGLGLDARSAARLLECWAAGATSLRAPAAGAAA